MATDSREDAHYMARALQLARRGLYTAAPNPCVGCVIVNGGRVVGEGWHARAGEAHAEAAALEQAGSAARGATVYVTLEPCTHHGRTPPCGNALIAAGVARVVAAARDPNPEVSGGGVEALEAAGVETEVGVCEAQARELNFGFFTRVRLKRPWVRIKWGMSLDGRVTAAGRKGEWITCDASRRDVQFQRARCGALMTGAGTVLADDPRLNLRLSSEELGHEGEVRRPLRVVVDGALRTSPSAQVYRLPGQVLLACREDVPLKPGFEDAGVEVRRFAREGEHLAPAPLLEHLAERGVNEVQVEAGPGLCGALIERGLYDEILLYVAPCLLGGAGLPPAALGGVVSVEQREALRWCDVRKVGDDLRILMRKEET